MMLTIHGLPSSVSHQELKVIIKHESNLDGFIMDNFMADGDGTKKVKIGVADASEGNHLINCLNGYPLRGSTLRVAPVAKAPRNPQGNFNQNPGDYQTYNNTQGRQPSNYNNQFGGPMNTHSSTWAPTYNQWNPQQQIKNNYGYQNGPVPEYTQQWQQRQQAPQQYQQQQQQYPQQQHQQQYPQQQHQQQYPQQQQLDPQKQIENELLKKKRQLIAEERRLLEAKLLAEKKKLEMLQGSSSSQMAGASNKNNKSQGPNFPIPKDKSNPMPKTYIPAPRGKGGVHIFAMPCKHLLKQMRPLVCKVTRDVKHQRRLLMKMIRADLRKILTKLVEGRGYMMTGPIMALFRQHYPIEDDEAFVTKIRKKLPDANKTMKKKKDKKAKRVGAGGNKEQNPMSIKKEEPNHGDSTKTTNQAESSRIANPIGYSNGVQKTEMADGDGYVTVEGFRSNNDVATQDSPSGMDEYSDEDDWVTNGVDWDDDGNDDN